MDKNKIFNQETHTQLSRGWNIWKKILSYRREGTLSVGLASFKLYKLAEFVIFQGAVTTQNKMSA